MGIHDGTVLACPRIAWAIKSSNCLSAALWVPAEHIQGSTVFEVKHGKQTAVFL
jgi:hypothetical protein